MKLVAITKTDWDEFSTHVRCMVNLDGAKIQDMRPGNINQIPVAAYHENHSTPFYDAVGSNNATNSATPNWFLGSAGVCS